MSQMAVQQTPAAAALINAVPVGAGAAVAANAGTAVAANAGTAGAANAGTAVAANATPFFYNANPTHRQSC